jgi:hypothetical protein
MEAVTFLPRDLLRYIQLNLVRYGVCDDNALRNWHCTCKEFYSDWCSDGYFLAMMQNAMDACAGKYTNTNHAEWFLKAGTLHNCYAGRRVAQRMLNYLPGITLALRLDINLCGSYSFADQRMTTVALLRDDLKSPIPWNDDKIGGEMVVALFLGAKWLHYRYGWRVVRKSKGNTVICPITNEPEWYEELALTCRPLNLHFPAQPLMKPLLCGE